MPVYKAYFKVIRKNLSSMLTYFLVFIAMATIFVKVVGSQTSFDFNATKNNIVIQSKDSSPLVDGLKEYLGQNANIVALPNDSESIKDALFFGKIDYVLRIPDGFTDSFLADSDTVTLEKTSGAMSASSVSMDLLINKYFNLARLYILNIPGIGQEDIVNNVTKDLGETVKVDTLISSEQVKTGGLNDTFRYMAYSILALMLMGITSIMMAFNAPELSRRNLCSPLSPVKMNLQLFAGNVVFTIIVWALLCIISLYLSGEMSLSSGVLVLSLNALAFSIVSLSIAFLAGKFIKSAVAQAALTNVLSLGICFLSGVFMPQEFIGQSVLRIASFTPGYWYVKAINLIKDISVYNFESLKPVINCMLIQLAFAAACIIIALVASKQKRQNMER